MSFGPGPRKGTGFSDQGSGLGFQSCGFRVQGSGLRCQGLACVIAFALLLVLSLAPACCYRG